jgi:endonuclease/exonuclease/phosphatase family metal-dependent hydrolase
MERQPANEPRVLIGDLNAYEEAPVKCARDPHPTALQRLRAAAYVDTWRATNGASSGFTGMLNRAGCGSPEGAPFKRPDYAWSRNLKPVSMRRFGLVQPGDCAPSDHLGIIAEYALPAERS